MRSTVLFFLLLLLGMVAVPVGATDEPPKGMSLFDGLEGDWQLTVREIDHSDKLIEHPLVTLTSREILRGRFLEQRGLFTFAMAPRKVEVILFWSYDRFQNKVRLALLDDSVGLLDTYEGMEKDGRVAVTNLASGTYFGKERAFSRMTLFDRTLDSYRLRVDTSTDGGKTWRETFHVEAKRK